MVHTTLPVAITPATATVTGAAVTGAAVTAAPYALVRVTALARPVDGPDAARHRDLTGRLVDALSRAAGLGGPLADALHACAATEGAEFHRRVVLPLRRDVHNRRSPRASVRAALGGLPDRLELLRHWLAARDDADRLLAEIAAGAPAALAADRRALAEACAAEPLRRAVTMVGGDLLRAVDRAAAVGDTPDARARKSEPTVLRYAVRASTRTVPLTWFAHVGWGRWGDTDGAPDATPTGSAQPDRRVLAELLGGVLADPRHRAERPHHLPGDLRTVDGQVVFRRSRPGHDSTGGVTDEVRLPLTGLLRHVVERVAAAGSVAPAVLAVEIAARLPAGAPGDAAPRYLARLAEQGLLVADLPVAPQDPAPLAALAALVGDTDPALTARLERIHTATRGFAGLDASRRPAALEGLRRDWDSALDAVGAPATVVRAPLAEDVTVPGVVALGPASGRAAVATLTRLAPLFEAVDLFTALHAVLADHVVEHHGIGGRAGSVARFAQDAGELWRRASLVGPDGAVRPDAFVPGPRLAAVAAGRARLASQVAAATTGDGDEVVLTDELVDPAREAGPRPVSYSVFAQPTPDGGLCVNRVYGGWGRFTSRFLTQLPPAAAADVTAQLLRALPGDGRAAQVRPVGGFTGNLHPRLLADEITDDPAWGTLSTRDVEVVHDADTDRVRLRHAPTGQLLDVLYLGFLVPFALPGHLGPLLNDLGSGLVDLAASLAPGAWRATAAGRVHVRPRLRHRDVVLARRRWRLPADVAATLRAELRDGGDVPAGVVARWRAALGLPAEVFVSSTGTGGGDGPGLDPLLERLGRPRSQFVDLGSALHLRCLARTLAGHPGDLVVEEALPVPRPGRPATELVIETYRSPR